MTNIPRILLTAPASGTGKTMITCGILSALKKRGIKTAGFKCGPDYIDPMFHREVLGVDSYNLDSFLCERENLSSLLISHAETKEMAVIEGVMGYYDGLGGISTKASAYEVADATNSPAVLIVDGKGASVSILPVIQGFLNYRHQEAKYSHIEGVILNRISPMMYGRLKELIERETKIKVYGYVPVIKDFTLESRHLGLKMPGEIEDIRKKLEELGDRLSETVDIDGLIALSQSASDLTKDLIQGKSDSIEGKNGYPLRIGVAMDEAFCFIYRDNLEILEKKGAEIVPFSPIHDSYLPEHLDGLLLYGGYPELYAKELASNESMRKDVKKALERGLVCMAECGGFQYLQQYLEDESGTRYEMCGLLTGGSYHTSSLKRFGYVTLSDGKVFGRDVGEISAHEFHYYDSENCGAAFLAKKPLSEKTWNCMISTDTLFAGYPHIHYAGNPMVAEAFLETCKKYNVRKE